MITLTQAREQMAALEATMRSPARPGGRLADLEADLARRRATWGPERPSGAPAPVLNVARVQRAVDAAIGSRAAAPRRLGYAEGMKALDDLEAIVRSPQLRRFPEAQRQAILGEVVRIMQALASSIREAVKPRARPAVYATTYPPRRGSRLVASGR